EVQLAVDLPDDLGQQQAAREQVVDDQDGVALGARESELRDGAGRRGRAQRGRGRHGEPSLKRGAEADSSKEWAENAGFRQPATAMAGSQRGFKWSGREDSNSRPPAPHAGALPGCATPRPKPSIIPSGRVTTAACRRVSASLGVEKPANLGQ